MGVKRSANSALELPACRRGFVSRRSASEKMCECNSESSGTFTAITEGVCAGHTVLSGMVSNKKTKIFFPLTSLFRLTL